MDRIPLLLELSDLHLPPGLADTLPEITDLTVCWTVVGVLLYVPTRHQLSRPIRRCPARVAAILRYARSLDCDYVLIGPDADIDQALPAWDR